MSFLSLLLIPLSLVATYLSALGLALVSYSPSAFQRHVAARGRPDAGDWVTDHRDDVLAAATFIRSIVIMTMLGVLLVDVIGIGESIDVTLAKVLICTGVGALLPWLTVSVFARAVSRYRAESIIAASMPLLHAHNVVLKPLSILSRMVDESVRRLLGAKHVECDDNAENLLLQRIEDEKLRGMIDDDAHAMLENVVEFRSTDVGEVMTPRTDIEGLDAKTTLVEAREFIEHVGHSRIPIHTENLDHIAGILYVKDLVRFLGRDDADFDLSKLLRKPSFVPDTMPVSELLRHFQQSEVHMAIVVDEYGGTAGLVTIEDVLEEIVGEIYDEHETTTEDEPTLHEINATKAEVDGRFHIDDLNDRLNLDLPEDDEFDTIGGFMLATLGHVPAVGEQFIAHDIRFTALAATDTQIERIGLELLQSDISAGK